MTPVETTGRRLFATQGEERYAIHLAANRSAWSDYDMVIGQLIFRTLYSDRIVEVRPRTNRTEKDTLRLLGVEPSENEILIDKLSLESQQANGAWYIPEEERFLVGVCQQSWWASQSKRFAVSAADSERAFAALNSVDSILVWAFIQPLMEVLWLPIKQRSGLWLGARKPELVQRDWQRIDAAYSALGIDSSAIDVYRDGKAWADLTSAQVIEARESLFEAWRGAPPDVGTRAICWHIDQLLDRYYARAKNGKAERSKTLNKGLERSLSAAFAGSWLQFVEYLGEEVHPSEQISTAVAPTSIVVTGRDKAEQAAEATGIPAKEVERVLAAYWDGADETPVDRRVAAMAKWWDGFNEIHSRHAKGMPSLWGLIGDRHEGSAPWLESDSRMVQGGYKALGREMCGEIETLWGTSVLARWPQNLVTEPYPHAAFAEAFGVAASFWEGISLTCWFLCEGPMSRTDLQHASSYYGRDLKALEDLGCPIDRNLFRDLQEAEKKLTERPDDSNDDTTEVAPGTSVTISVSYGAPKKDGYEHLRDVVTKYRREWASQYLNEYLASRWEHDLRTAGDAYHRQSADKGKPPTSRQFAKMAQESARNWFGGDISQVCDALNLPAPPAPGYERRLPADRAGFVALLNERLGGRSWDQTKDLPNAERTAMINRSRLAERGPDVVQVWEATGELPPLKGNSWAKSLLESDYGADAESGWLWFIQQVAGAAQDTPAPKQIDEPARFPTYDPVEAKPVASQQVPDAHNEKKGWRRIVGG